MHLSSNFVKFVVTSTTTLSKVLDGLNRVLQLFKCVVNRSTIAGSCTSKRIIIYFMKNKAHQLKI